jgi:hypothetical protein
LGVIPSAARDLLFELAPEKKQIPWANTALGMTLAIDIAQTLTAKPTSFLNQVRWRVSCCSRNCPGE